MNVLGAFPACFPGFREGNLSLPPKEWTQIQKNIFQAFKFAQKSRLDAYRQELWVKNA
jgi:hypothetical protein